MNPFDTREPAPSLSDFEESILQLLEGEHTSERDDRIISLCSAMEVRACKAESDLSASEAAREADRRKLAHVEKVTEANKFYIAKIAMDAIRAAFRGEPS